MKRKIMLIGGKTCVVSIPAEFVRNNELKKGDEVSLNLDGNQLQLTTNNLTNTKEISINLDNEKYINQTLTLFYTLGIDQIKINCNSKILEKIENQLESFFGLEIIKYLPQGCIIKSMVIAIPDIDNLLNQCFYKTAKANSQTKIKSTTQTINHLQRYLTKLQTKKANYYLRILAQLKFLMNESLIEDLRILTFKFNLEDALELRNSNIPKNAKELLDIIIEMNL